MDDVTFAAFGDELEKIARSANVIQGLLRSLPPPGAKPITAAERYAARMIEARQPARRIAGEFSAARQGLGMDVRKIDRAMQEGRRLKETAGDVVAARGVGASFRTPNVGNVRLSRADAANLRY